MKMWIVAADKSLEGVQAFASVGGFPSPEEEEGMGG